MKIIILIKITKIMKKVTFTKKNIFLKKIIQKMMKKLKEKKKKKEKIN